MSNNCIKDVRKKRKMTQVELAKKMGVSQSAINLIETGQRGLDIEWMNKFADALNCEPWELLPKEMQPNITPEEMEVLRAVRKAKETVAKTENLSQTKAS